MWPHRLVSGDILCSFVGYFFIICIDLYIKEFSSFLVGCLDVLRTIIVVVVVNVPMYFMKNIVPGLTAEVSEVSCLSKRTLFAGDLSFFKRCPLEKAGSSVCLSVEMSVSEVSVLERCPF